MKVEIITIGDEIMSGDVADSNFTWLAEKLWNAGYEVHTHTSIADRPEDMNEAFQRALRSDLVFVTGGLGPTSDDRTLAVAAETFGKKLVQDDQALEAIEKRLKIIGREMNESQGKQALYPEGGVMFPNVKGTAPGCRLKYKGTHFIFLVGVPSEMHEQWDRDVWPYLQGLPQKPEVLLQRIFRCFGPPEAELEEALKDFAVVAGGPSESFASETAPEKRGEKGTSSREGTGLAQGPSVRLSYRIKFPEILIKIACRSGKRDLVTQALDRAEEFIRGRVGHAIYSMNDETIEKVIGGLLIERKETLAIAESCTGGFIANLVTDVPGSSNYFKQAVVSYSNEAKQDLLGISKETLETFGAVSSEAAMEMAKGVRERAKSTYGIAVTGIAGPSGGTEEKPIGTVHVALATPDEIEEKEYHFPYGRHYFKIITAHVALHKLRRYLMSLSGCP